MYELIKINENDYYIDCPSKAGIVRIGENEAILIDAGSDRGAGKKIKKALDSLGLTVKAIYVTHSHADHIGGARYLSEATGCRIFARGIECAFTRHPILEGGFLYGGFTPSELRHKFMLAEESDCEYLSENSLPEGFRLIELPGHSFDMIGILTPDGTAYIADALSSEKTLEKYRIGVIYDVGVYLNTLRKLKEMRAEIFVPSHVTPSKDLSSLIDYNISSVEKIIGDVLRLAGGGIGFEELLGALFTEYGLTMTVEQYAMVGSTLRSYLSYLKEDGRLSIVIEESGIKWKTV